MQQQSRQSHRETIEKLVYLKDADMPPCRAAQSGEGKLSFGCHVCNIVATVSPHNTFAASGSMPPG
ncbi:MAG: hypothetical protein ACWA49_01750 [Ruegeria sp.]